VSSVFQDLHQLPFYFSSALEPRKVRLANNGLMRRSKMYLYAITSSALCNMGPMMQAMGMRMQGMGTMMRGMGMMQQDQAQPGHRHRTRRATIDSHFLSRAI